MQAKRIVILHLAHWDQLLGGAEQQLKYLSEFLLKKGHELHFIYLDRTAAQVEKEGVINHPIKHIKLPGRFGKYWFIYKKQLLKKLRKINPDVLITRTRSSWAGFAADYAKENKIKHIHYIASDKDVVFERAKAYRVFDIVENQFYKKVFAGGSNIVCQNEYQQSSLEKYFGIHSRLQTQAAPAPTESAIPKKSCEKIIVVWVANMKSLKRPEKFIQLAKHFDGNPNFCFVMIGGDGQGHYKELLANALKQPNFFYKGALSNDEVNKELESAHFLVNTSDYEGFSNTFVQAWLRGVFVYSLNTDPDFIMQRHQVGMKLDSIESIAESIKLLVTDTNKLLNKASEIESYALKNHSIDKVYSNDFR